MSRGFSAKVASLLGSTGSGEKFKVSWLATNMRERRLLGTKNNPDLTSVLTTMVSGIDAIEVPGRGYRARIALVGATLLDWRTVSADGQEGESIVDGYRDIEELQSQNGVRNGILAPFSNRIEGGKIQLAGSAYQISPVAAVETAVYHGFARVRPFRLHKVDSDGENVRAVLRRQAFRTLAS
ncbi:aldose 1-epimerase [Agrobacterium vitis]|nr:aldose 1-epimerase [Agrobacterium vitis]